MKAFTKPLLAAIIAVIATFSFSQSVQAQITYSSNGLSIQGAPKHAYLGLTVDKYLGLYWTCKGSNFFQLDISPSNPRLAGTGDQVVFYNSATSTFNSIQVANVYNYSDARAKANIQTLTSGMSKLLALRPVSYNWKENVPTPSRLKAQAATVSATSAPVSTVAYGPETDNNLQYGFLAQEVEAVLPNAVHTDEEGHKLINYTALIPMLVEAVQELQSTVEKQSAVIAQLQSSSKGFVATSKTNDMGKILAINPNPTTGYTTISFDIPSTSTNAYISISSISGNKEGAVQIPKGAASVTYDASSLTSGIHVVSLFVEGNLADSGRLIRE